MIVIFLSGNADEINRVFDSSLEKIRFVWSCGEDILGLRKTKKTRHPPRLTLKCKRHFSILIIFFTRRQIFYIPAIQVILN